MTTATGQVALDFSGLSDTVAPAYYTNAALVGSPAWGRIISGALHGVVAAGEAVYGPVADTQDGEDVEAIFEIVYVDSDDQVGFKFYDSSGNGYKASFTGTALYIDFVTTGDVLVDNVAFATGVTFTAGDLFSFKVNPGAVPGTNADTLTFSKNGTPLTLSATTYTHTHGLLKPNIRLIPDGGGAQAIRSIAFNGVEGVSANPGLRTEPIRDKNLTLLSNQTDVEWEVFDGWAPGSTSIADGITGTTNSEGRFIFDNDLIDVDSEYKLVLFKGDETSNWNAVAKLTGIDLDA